MVFLDRLKMADGSKRCFVIVKGLEVFVYSTMKKLCDEHGYSSRNVLFSMNRRGVDYYRAGEGIMICRSRRVVSGSKRRSVSVR